MLCLCGPDEIDRRSGKIRQGSASKRGSDVYNMYSKIGSVVGTNPPTIQLLSNDSHVTVITQHGKHCPRYSRGQDIMHMAFRTGQGWIHLSTKFHMALKPKIMQTNTERESARFQGTLSPSLLRTMLMPPGHDYVDSYVVKGGSSSKKSSKNAGSAVPLVEHRLRTGYRGFMGPQLYNSAGGGYTCRVPSLWSVSFQQGESHIRRVLLTLYTCSS
jgi:hypothetical protein